MIFLDHGNAVEGPQFYGRLPYLAKSAEFTSNLAGVLNADGAVWLMGCNSGNAKWINHFAHNLGRNVVAPIANGRITGYTRNPVTGQKSGLPQNATLFDLPTWNFRDYRTFTP